jgi:hypothetical protein
MDLEPRVVKVESEEQLRKQVAELEKQGRRVIYCNALPDGICGKLAFWVPPPGKEEAWTPKDADAIWLTWEKFGRMLEPHRTKVATGNQLFELFSEHKDHGIIGYLDDKQAGFICFCKAKEGISNVFFIDLVDMKEVPPELRKYINTAAQVIDSSTRG